MVSVVTAAGVQIRELEDILPTPASIIVGVGLKEKGKEKVLEQSDDEESIEEDYDDYNPAFNDEEYDQYERDDDYENERKAEESVTRVPGDEEFINDDDDDRFVGLDPDDEILCYTINSNGEREEVELEFNPKTDMDNVEFKIGMKFSMVEILRDALREHAIQGGWEYVNVKNDKQRIKTVCKEDNCPLFLFAYKISHQSTVKIRQYNPEHKCERKFNNMVRQKYLARKFKDQIALNENWKPAKSSN